MKLTHNRPPIHLFAAISISLLLTACGGGSGGSIIGNSDPSVSYTVTASAGTGGSFDSTSATVDSGNSTSFIVTADTGYGIDSVTGCGGSLSGDTYTTGAITADCTITASFIQQHTVTASAGANGTIDPTSTTVNQGSNTSFTVTPDAGYGISSVTGCGGSLSGNTYTTGAINADCAVSASFVQQYTVTASASTGGSFDSSSATVDSGSSTSFTLTPDTGYSLVSVTGCGGSLSGTTYTTGAITADCTVSASFAINQYQVLTNVAYNNGGGFDLPGALVNHGSTTSFTLTADTGYSLASVSGCGGSLSGNTYTTGVITSDCTVTASFDINKYTVTASAGANGTIDPSSVLVNHGSSTSFTVTPDAGYGISSVTGCGGSLSGNTYTTEAITADCAISASFTNGPASAPTPTLNVTTKQLRFSWPAVANTDHYRVLVNPDGASGFSVVEGAESISGLSHSIEVSVHLFDWVAAEYLVEACNADESVCLSSANQTLTAADSIAATVYAKASNTGAQDYFGYAVSLSSDGNTLAVGANGEHSNATGYNGDQNNDSLANAGAVYIFIRNNGAWSQQAYLKASNTDADDYFGESVSLSADGNTLAVGAHQEDGIAGDPTSNAVAASGAVYVFTRSGIVWSQQAYLKASNADTLDGFGYRVSLSADGNSLAVGAYLEDSSASGGEGDNSAQRAGAAYVFTRSGSAWSQQAYLKASNAEASDEFGYRIALSGDGTTLAVGAWAEDSASQGIDGLQSSNTSSSSGAVYVFSLSGSTWSQQAYVKASNSRSYIYFGSSLALSNDGNTLAVGAWGEKSAATGVDGSQADTSVLNAGAAYVFSRSGVTWSQQAYIKATNTGTDDRFGTALALSADGALLAVATQVENGSTSGIDGIDDDLATNAGAVYVYQRSGTTWSHRSYVKASNTGAYDNFGTAISLSGVGDILAVGAVYEDSAATGINGNQSGNTVTSAGAVYLY